MMPRIRRAVFVARPCLVAAGLLFLTGCSIRQSTVDMIGDALSGGAGVYASDNDAELIREALPFGLKMFESLLEASPSHQGLLLATAKGFTAYAYLLQDQADRLETTDLAGAQRLRARARRLYVRGRDYALRGLDRRSRGFTANLRQDRATALQMTQVNDVALLYWAGAAWAGAISAAKNDPYLLIDLPTAGALIARVVELDEGYDGGAAREFLIAFEAGRPGGSLQLARAHYQRALELSGGDKASVYLALAEGVALREQNLAEFERLIQAALAVDPQKHSQLRLANTIAQQRAQWLQSRINELFLETGPLQEKLE
ncbi:MAG: TRAP transporter TatT component family protein [Candidatus Binatia bacterium]